jgi:hypothetical protein
MVGSPFGLWRDGHSGENREEWAGKTFAIRGFFLVF